jgi:hypothetical protein
MESIIELPTEAFNFETAIKLIKKIEIKDKLYDDNKDCINYLHKYFYQVSGGFYFYNYNYDSFIYYDIRNVKLDFFNKFNEDIKNNITSKNIITYDIINDNFKPRIFMISNVRYINMSKFYLLKKLVKPYESFSDEVKNNTKLLLNYIYDVLANKDDEVYNYLLKWYSNVFKGIKNNSVLYLKSIEGTGKSTLSDFIQQYILSDGLSVKCGTDPLKGNYNSILKNSIYVRFEEMPTFSTSEWIGVSSKLKDLITSDKIIINEKYEKAYECDNRNNYIICTNHNAIQHSEGRRYFILDVSTEYVNDNEYYGNLRSKTFNKEVAQAFYNYIIEVDTTNFYAQNMPITNNKKKVIEKSLLTEYKFIRDEYILKEKGLDGIKRTTLYENYKVYCITNNLVNNNKSSSSFYEKLENVNIKSVKNSVDVYKTTYDILLKIANNNKWLVGVEYNIKDDEEVEEKKPSDLSIIEENEQLKKIIKELKEENEQLKKENTKLKNNDLVDINKSLWGEIEEYKKELEYLTNYYYNNIEKELKDILTVDNNDNDKINVNKSSKMYIKELEEMTFDESELVTNIFLGNDNSDNKKTKNKKRSDNNIVIPKKEEDFKFYEYDILPNSKASDYQHIFNKYKKKDIMIIDDDNNDDELQDIINSFIGTNKTYIK